MHKRPSNWIFFLLILFLLPVFAWSQTRADLESRKNRLAEEIKITNEQLKETRDTKEKTYDRLLTLRAAIEKREELVQTMEEELDWVQSRIDRNKSVIEALEQDLNNLKKEYGEMLRQSLRYKLNYSSLMLIFSAESLNQAFRRWRYLQQYHEYRERQAKMIRLTQETLEDHGKSLQEQFKKQQGLLEEMKNEQAALASSLAEEDELLKDLTKNEAQLKQDLLAQERTRKELDKAIEELIQKELAAAAAREKAGRSPAKSSVTVALSRDFRQNRGKLPWPVEKGVITRKYGKQQHPNLKSVFIKNNGIDILTDEKATVSAVFQGKVSGMQYIPGFNRVLIIQHGNYYSVYSNLAEVYVRRGEEVKTRQVIGRVGEKKNGGQGNLHFEVWEGKKRLNPGYWIQKK